MKMEENIEQKFEKEYKELSELCEQIREVDGVCLIAQSEDGEIAINYNHLKNRKINYV